MKTKLGFVIALLVVAGSLRVGAATYTDLDLYYTDDPTHGGTQINETESLVGFFQIRQDQYDGDGGNGTGYNPVSEEIISARAFFYLANGDTLLTSTVDIFLGEAELRAHDGEEVLTFRLLVGGVTGTALFDLQEDGTLRYEITAESGVLALLEAQVIADAGPRSIGVPDGGSSMVLLGFGFIALGVLKRKLAA